MIFCNEPKPFPYLKVREFYYERELGLIWQELDFLTYKDKLEPPSETGQKDNDMKSNSGVFLDSLYKSRSFSNILTVNRKLFSRDIMEAMVNLDKIMSAYYNNCDHDGSLISYYEQADYYKSHVDRTIITSISWHFKKPKMFTGGDLIFTDYNERIEIDDNMLVIFPSCIRHQVTAIEMNPGVEPFRGYGRYALSNFVGYDHNKT